MEQCYEEGRIVQLTYQLTTVNNQDLFIETPMIELLRYGDDERIRRFARDAAAFGKPFLFRLNNEMNSDWTSYSGVVNLADPDLFIKTWRMIYDIFREEGVNNAIWIFNPNDKDFPPAHWNSFAAYYPGNGYVHMFGLTGYNTGNYYRDVFGERWREFGDIYHVAIKEYAGLFDAFPWIITEFASSSIGGNKVRWIDNMFAVLPEFPQIRAAVWFSAPDYDFRPGLEHIAARPFWLNETPETLEAFRRGRVGN
jgi:beta-mannanase